MLFQVLTVVDSSLVPGVAATLMMLRVCAVENASAISCWLNTVGENTVGENTVGLNTVGENTVGLTPCTTNLTTSGLNPTQLLDCTALATELSSIFTGTAPAQAQFTNSTVSHNAVLKLLGLTSSGAKR